MISPNRLAVGPTNFQYFHLRKHCQMMRAKFNKLNLSGQLARAIAQDVDPLCWQRVPNSVLVSTRAIWYQHNLEHERWKAVLPTSSPLNINYSLLSIQYKTPLSLSLPSGAGTPQDASSVPKIQFVSEVGCGNLRTEGPFSGVCRTLNTR